MLERSYSPKEAAAILGVTVHTIQVWDRQGKMHCLRLPSGRRSIPESEVRRLLSLKQRRVFVIYARVSSYDQREYLGRQIERLKKMVPEAVVLSDVLSGLNFKRKGLQKLLNMVIHEEVDKVYVTHKDRLARFGYDLLETLFKRFGTEIV